MGTKMHFELNPDGVAALLRSDTVGEQMERVGERMARAANANARAAGFPDARYDVRRFAGRDRTRVHVGVATRSAVTAEIEARALTRARGAAR